jgi:hypothetical protein
VALGLFSRSETLALPWSIAKYAGDGLWGLVVFLGSAVLLPTKPTRLIAALAVVFAVGVEISQLFHPAWLDLVRRTTPGALVLGTPDSAFAWADLAAYFAGIAVGVLTDRAIRTPALFIK